MTMATDTIRRATAARASLLPDEDTTGTGSSSSAKDGYRRCCDMSNLERVESRVMARAIQSYRFEVPETLPYISPSV